MKKMTKKQVIKSAIKIVEKASKSLDKILTENDMYFDPINKDWCDGPINHSNDKYGNWENVTSNSQCRDGIGLFYEVIYGDTTAQDRL